MTSAEDRSSLEAFLLAEKPEGDVGLRSGEGSGAQDVSVTRFVDVLLRRAVRARASDLHFEPFEEELIVRQRVDGALGVVCSAARSLASPVTARLKVMADLNLAECRVPQDGRIPFAVDGRTVDLRISTLPTQFGESVVLRILDGAEARLTLADLELPSGILQSIRSIVRRPNGLLVVTGPTGSGKTTTLMSALREVVDEETKILTVEDPVEYEVEGLVQVSVNSDIGLTFSTALRAFLRQDPDKILVGEIRDGETAQVAVQASLTGHLVLTTLHTNDAAGAVTRLANLGVEPYLLSATLEGVLAQRLVRRICEHCRILYEADAGCLEALGLSREEAGRRNLAKGEGCEACGASGYRGRLGLYEFIQASDRIRESIARRTGTLCLAAIAKEEGTVMLRQYGIGRMLAQITTAEEILRNT